MGSDGPEAATASHELGRTLRHHFDGMAGESQWVAEGPRLMAMLQDCHAPRSGDAIVYEWVMRQQGFLALLRPAPNISPAIREPSVQALVEDARTIFNTDSLQRIRAFLEGFITATNQQPERSTRAPGERSPQPPLTPIPPAEKIQSQSRAAASIRQGLHR